MAKDISDLVQAGAPVPGVLANTQPAGHYLLQKKNEITAEITRLQHELSMIDQAGIIDPVALLDQAAPALSTIMPEALAQIERRSTGKELPLPLPWPDLDKAMGGGLWPGLHVLVGGTGSGKTQFALQIAHHAAMNIGTPVLYIGLEMERVQLAARLLGIESGKYWSTIYRGEVESTCLKHARSMLEALPMHLENAGPYGDWNYNTLKDRAEAFKKKYRDRIEIDGHQVRPFLIVLDFLQLVTAPGDSGGGDIRQTIQRASYAARAVARDLGAAVILISSTAREHYRKMITQLKQNERTYQCRGENRGGNALAWIDVYEEEYLGTGKEAGEVEYSADSVLVLTRGEYQGGGAPRPIHLCLAKNREGRTAWVDLEFNGNKFSVPAERPRQNI